VDVQFRARRAALVASDRVGGDRRQSWAFGQRPAVGAPESQLAVGTLLDLIALLVDGAMMTTTE